MRKRKRECARVGGVPAAPAKPADPASAPVVGAEKAAPDVAVERSEAFLLVADDDPAVRSALERALRARGYPVLTAENGLEALSIATESLSRIAVLITDIEMPLLGGIEVVERLRRLRRSLPVLFLSGSGAEPSRVRVRDTGTGTGPTVWMRKPVRLDEIHAVISGLPSECVVSDRAPTSNLHDGEG